MHGRRCETVACDVPDPEDVAEGVLYLASDMSNYATGTVPDLDGGMRTN